LDEWKREEGKGMRAEGWRLGDGAPRAKLGKGRMDSGWWEETR
jgi:hypothetical protein